jgi:hypothetical protein
MCVLFAGPGFQYNDLCLAETCFLHSYILGEDACDIFFSHGIVSFGLSVMNIHMSI